MTPTARRVVDMLAKQGPMTLRDLGLALGVTNTAVREQVCRLLDDGWLERSQRRGRTGRPADVYTLAARAQRVFGAQLGDLGRSLAQAVLETCDAAMGRRILDSALRRLLDAKMAATGRSSLEPQKRLAQLARSLREDGDLVETDGDENHLRLKLFTCPYGELAADFNQVCEIEREALSKLVGRPVAIVHRRPDGHACCELALDTEPVPTSAAGHNGCRMTEKQPRDVKRECEQGDSI